MSEALRVNDEKMAKEIAIEAVRSMWRYTSPAPFMKLNMTRKANAGKWRQTTLKEDCH